MKILKGIKYYFNSLIDLFYPDFCSGCGRPLLTNEHYICTDCIVDLPYTHWANSRNNVVTDLLMGRIISLNKGYSMCYFTKKSNLQNILHELKYSKKPELGKELGIYLGNELKRVGLDDFDILLPVPLHPRKKQIRGYNQSEKIAEGIAQVINKPIETKAVVRAVFTETQTKKSKVERWENVKNIFEVKNPKKLENKHILIVDDVLTTGSTIEALSEIIEKNVQNTKISIATVAVARKM